MSEINLKEQLDFAGVNSVDMTSDVVDFITERFADTINNSDIVVDVDDDVICELVSELLVQVGANLQRTPEEWV